MMRTNSPLFAVTYLLPYFHYSIVPSFPPGRRPYGPEANCERNELNCICSANDSDSPGISRLKARGIYAKISQIPITE